MTDQPAVSGVVVADNEQRLRQQISETREQLGDTVAELAAKANVKHQVQVRSAALASSVRAKANRMERTASKEISAARERRVPLAAAGVTVGLGSLALLLWKRKRNRAAS